MNLKSYISMQFFYISVFAAFACSGSSQNHTSPQHKHPIKPDSPFTIENTFKNAESQSYVCSESDICTSILKYRTKTIDTIQTWTFDYDSSSGAAYYRKGKILRDTIYDHDSAEEHISGQAGAIYVIKDGIKSNLSKKMKYFDASLSSYIRSGKNIFYYGILCDESKCSHIYAASYNLITGKNIAIKLNKEPHEPEGLGYFPSPVIVGDSVAFPKVLGTDKEVKFLKF